MKNVFLCLFLLALCAVIANAQIITIEITGVVTDIRDLEDYPYDEHIYVGDTFTGTYTYDSATSDSSSQIDRGSYVQNSPYGFNISLGGFEFKTAESHVDQFRVTILDDYGLQTRDSYQVESSQNAPLSTGISVDRIYWGLSDYTYTALSSDGLPTEAPNINAWGYNTFNIACGTPPGGNSPFAVWGTVTQAQIVPEPATFAMFGIGVAFLRRRNQ